MSLEIVFVEGGAWVASALNESGLSLQTLNKFQQMHSTRHAEEKHHLIVILRHKLWVIGAGVRKGGAWSAIVHFPRAQVRSEDRRLCLVREDAREAGLG